MSNTQKSSTRKDSDFPVTVDNLKDIRLSNFLDFDKQTSLKLPGEQEYSSIPNDILKDLSSGNIDKNTFETILKTLWSVNSNLQTLCRANNSLLKFFKSEHY